ncbi:helix-turn-helix domain-containing protein [Actinacidiphila paucisporea]|uniref:Predicted transcriptional regulator, ArsR family n=1 Tax=Actinacidiphila paucisporea TaxID=310782 RepID=A0A1M7K3U7_9ACTN|nr:helix-turn-helix domain-containing protein [Actinacidiphila paucisporea]SHM59970.1 Predicted transcriptional regulator, ArsR family [Actinacidiphila paucisporea]
MSDDRQDRTAAHPTGPRRDLPDHPIRIALLDLLAEAGTVTSTQAAARLGHSSGLCSFHLRQLARHGLIEEAPHSPGRGGPRPWRLRWEPATVPDGFTALTRDLEDAAYRRRLAELHQAPPQWRHDESFSAVAHLTPAETAEVAAGVRRLLVRFRDRDDHPAARPADAVPVAVVARLFPLPPDTPGPGTA